MSSSDPLMSECLIYQIKPGKTEVGRMDSEKPAAIRLSGESIAEEHCYFENNDGKVMLYALPDAVTVRLVRYSRFFFTPLITLIVPQRMPNNTWSSSCSVSC